jgi:hypothetical protein
MIDLWDETAPLPDMAVLPPGRPLGAAIKRLVERIDAMVAFLSIEQFRHIINPAACIQLGVDIERFRMSWATPLGIVLPTESFGSGGASLGPMSTDYLLGYLGRLRAALVKAGHASNEIMIGHDGRAPQ